MPSAVGLESPSVGGQAVYCSKCGSAIAEGSTTCLQCGQSTPEALVVAASGAPPVAAPWVAPVGMPAVLPARLYAGFWLRLLAYIIDSFVLGIFQVPILVGGAMMMGLASTVANLPRGGDPFATGFPPVFAAFFSLLALVVVVGGWLYHALLESSEWQATLGKKVLGLAVTDLVGARVSFARASGRHFAKFISGFIPLGIGYILAGVTEKKQALHDMIAGCLVLRKT
jgi:uncharacterized RDD family membrane protein YckC